MKSSSNLAIKSGGDLNDLEYCDSLVDSKLARSKSELFTLLALTVLLSGSAYFRMHNLTVNGTVGSDTFQYWAITFEWLKGHFILNPLESDTRHYFRPTFYALNCLAVFLFGKHDYAIRGLMGIFETGNVLLVFLLSRRFFHSRLLGLCVSAVYAAVPSAIIHSQTELPHTFSVTWVLLMFLVFVSSSHWSRITKPTAKALVGSGLFAGLAATTHGSCTFYGPTLILLWSLSQLTSVWSRKQKLREWFMLSFRSSVFVTLGFMLPYLLFGGLVGYRYMVWALASETSIRTGADENSWKLFVTYLTKGPQESICGLAEYLFLCAAVLTIFRAAFGRITLREASPIIVLLFFAGLFSFVFQNVFYSRLFLPLNIFVLLTIFSGARFLISLIRLPEFLMLFPLAYVLGSSAAESQIGTLMEHYRGDRVGPMRAVYDVIGKEVNQSRKLLVAPSIQYNHQLQFKSGIYFGENAVYLFECNEGTLSDFVKRNEIGFIFLSQDLDWRILNDSVYSATGVGACAGMSVKNYDLNLELSQIREFMTKHEAKQLPLKGVYGELYTLLSQEALSGDK